MSFVNFSPLFLSAYIHAWVRLNKVALEKRLSWLLGAGLKEVVPFYQGKPNTVAQQNHKVCEVAKEQTPVTWFTPV